MYPFKHKFFRNRERAEAFALEVDGKVYSNDEKNFKEKLEEIEYPDGLEEFEYIVIWLE